MKDRKEVLRCALCPRLLSTKNKSGLCQACYIDVYKYEKQKCNCGKNKEKCMEEIKIKKKNKKVRHRHGSNVYKDYLAIY